MDGVSALALVGALIRRLQRNGVLTGEDGKAIYDAAIKAIMSTSKHEVDTTPPEEWVEILRTMAAKLDLPPGEHP